MRTVLPGRGRIAFAIGVTAAILVMSEGSRAAEVMELEEIDASRVRWSELSYKAKKLGFSAGTDLKLSSVAAAEAAAELYVPPEGEARSPGSSEVALLTMETKGLGQDSLTRLWFDPANATAFQRDQHDRRKGKQWRAYRYLEEGVASVTHRPAAGEKGQSPDRWSDRSTGSFEFPDWLGDGALVTEPAAVFFIAAAAALDEVGDRIQVPTFTKNKLLLVELEVVGIEQLKADYTQKSSAGERRVSGRVDAIHISVDSRRLGPDSEEGDFEFLGLRGDVEMWVDQTTRVPIQISGRVPVVGKAHVRLRRAVVQ